MPAEERKIFTQIIKAITHNPNNPNNPNNPLPGMPAEERKIFTQIIKAIAYLVPYPTPSFTQSYPNLP